MPHSKDKEKKNTKLINFDFEIIFSVKNYYLLDIFSFKNNYKMHSVNILFVNNWWILPLKFI